MLLQSSSTKRILILELKFVGRMINSSFIYTGTGCLENQEKGHYVLHDTPDSRHPVNCHLSPEIPRNSPLWLCPDRRGRGLSWRRRDNFPCDPEHEKFLLTIKALKAPADWPCPCERGRRPDLSEGSSLFPPVSESPASERIPRAYPETSNQCIHPPDR